MAFEIAPDTSFCECRGRFIFLDLEREHYFALNPDSNRAFANLLAGTDPTAEDERSLFALAEQGLIAKSAAGSKPAPCRGPRLPRRSLIDMPMQAGTTDTFWALARLAAASRAIRRKPLRDVLGRLAERKAKKGLLSPLEDELSEIAAAFRRSALIASPLDQCLPRSLAAAHMLLDWGLRSDLVIAVRTGPFAAHCWLQTDLFLINESLDEARNFTPILVI